jgi:hypothetical protein
MYFDFEENIDEMYMCAKNHNLNVSGCWEIGKI